MMTSGETTAVEIAEGYLKNIEQLDKRINSIIEVNPEALEIAARLDAERKAGKVRGPLHGIPVVIKDNIDTADKMKTTAGSLGSLECADAETGLFHQYKNCAKQEP
jgi:amidase